MIEGSDMQTHLPLDITVLSHDPIEKSCCEHFLSHCLQQSGVNLQQALAHPNSLPIFWYQKLLIETNVQLSIFCIGPFRQRFFKYFYEFCLNVGLPNAQPDPLCCSAFDFYCAKYPNYPRLTLCKVQLQVKDDQEADCVIHALNSAQKHLRSGMWTGNFNDWSIWQQSASEDEKISRIYGRWGELSIHMPPELAKITGIKLHQLIASISKKLIYERSSRHILDIARSMALPIWQYNLQSKSKERSAKRRCWVQHSVRGILSHDKPTLMDCYIVTLNYLRSHETLEERHLLQALRELHLTQSPAHFFANFKDPETKFQHFYLEIPFVMVKHAEYSSMQKKVLLRNLGDRILGCIERKQLRIFQPRNDEDALKRLVTLAKEVQHSEDLPQVSLSFEEQTDDRLIFCFSMARPLPLSSDYTEWNGLVLGPEILVKINKLRKIEEDNLTKEITLAHIEVSKALFVREDYSVDLHRARLHILRHLEVNFGQLRDYNGGLIAKQHHLLEQVLGKLGHLTAHHQLLVEEVFFALQPSIATTSFDSDELCHFFKHLLQSQAKARRQSKSITVYWHSYKDLILIVALSSHDDNFDELCERLQHLLVSSTSVASASIHRPHRNLYATIARHETSDITRLKKQVRKQLSQQKITVDYT